jgi:hypothetical protein
MDTGRLYGLLAAKEKLNIQKVSKAATAARDASLTMPGDLAAIPPPT